MKVAAIQMVSNANVTDNLNSALELIKEAANQGAQLIALPEYFCIMPKTEEERLAATERVYSLTHTPIQTMLAQAAKQYNIWLVGGTIPIKAPESPHLVYNTALVYAPTGMLEARYDKIHLFRFDGQTEQHDEAQSHLAGTTPTTFSLDVDNESYKVGLSICYDLRFPELYRALSAPFKKPCDLIFVPSAFTYATGQDHWEILLRARAIENQCYIIAPAQGGQHDNGRRTWGHTMIISPWGKILSQLDEGTGIVYADIDKNYIQRIRQQLPALQNRMLVD